MVGMMIVLLREINNVDRHKERKRSDNRSFPRYMGSLFEVGESGCLDSGIDSSSWCGFSVQAYPSFRLSECPAMFDLVTSCDTEPEATSIPTF